MKKPIYKRWWFWVIIVVLVIGIGGAASSGDDSEQKPNNATTQTEEPTNEPAEEEADIPKEYESALKKAETYSELMHMSKQGIYDQLVSEYGEQFSEEAAQYAMDNLDADYKQNALEKAKIYQEFAGNVTRRT